MRKIIMIKIIILAISLLFITGSLDASSERCSDVRYMLTERYNRPFCDINKTKKGDTRMCWAATISNMSGFSLEHKPETVFRFFKKNHPNAAKSIYNGFFLLFQSMGYRKSDFLLLTSFCSRNWNSRIDLYIIGTLYQGRVVNIGVDKTKDSEIGHALTVYGFEIVKKKLYLFYVDSNDGIRKLYRERIKHKRGITRVITGRYKGYIIDNVASLQIME